MCWETGCLRLLTLCTYCAVFMKNRCILLDRQRRRLPFWSSEADNEIWGLGMDRAPMQKYNYWNIDVSLQLPALIKHLHFYLSKKSYTEAPNSPKTNMINGVLLQTPGTLLTACFREPRQVCLNCAGLWLWVVQGFRTVQIPRAGRHWHFRA